jgi:hypothetical protein
MGSHPFIPNGPGTTRYDPGADLGRDVETNHDKGALATLTAQAAGTVNSAEQVNPNCRGVLLVVDITAASGTAALTLKSKAKTRPAASGSIY